MIQKLSLCKNEHSNSQSCKAGQRVSLTTYCPWATCLMLLGKSFTLLRQFVVTFNCTFAHFSLVPIVTLTAVTTTSRFCSSPYCTLHFSTSIFPSFPFPFFSPPSRFGLLLSNDTTESENKANADDQHTIW